MSTQALAIIDTQGKAQLPAHLQQAFADDGNIVTGDRTPSLGIKGKVFSVNNDGDTTPLMRHDPDSGEEVPVSSLPVIILDYNVAGTKTGRSYYEGAYDPNDTKGPLCYSLDGIVPEPEVEEKQSNKCATCQWSVKGSRVGDGGKTSVACAPNRILAIVPAKAMASIPPLRLKLAQTSNYDGRSPEARQRGMFAFQNYLDSLKARGIPNTRAVVTSLSFDPEAPHPKVFFKAVRYVSEEEHAQIEAIMASGKVEEITTWTGTIAAHRGEGHRPEFVEIAGPAREVEAKPATTAKAVPEKVAPIDISAAQAASKARIDAATKAFSSQAQASALPVAPVREEGEDEDDFNIRVSQHRKALRLAETAVLAAKPAAAAEFKAPAMEDGEDEDDYNIRVITAKKAWKAAQTPAAAAKPVEFVAPTQEEGEDEDDFNIRVSQARKAHKAKHGAPAAAQTVAAAIATEAKVVPTAEAEKPKRTRRTAAQIAADEAAKAAGTAQPLTKAQEQPVEKFLPAAAAMADLGGDDEGGELTVASTTGKAGGKAPIAAVEAPLPDDVSSMLESWGDE